MGKKTNTLQEVESVSLKAADFYDLPNPSCRDFIVLSVFKSCLAFIDSVSCGFPAVGTSPQAFLFSFLVSVTQT